MRRALAALMSSIVGLAAANAVLGSQFKEGFEETFVAGGFFRATTLLFVRPKVFLVAEKEGDIFAVVDGKVIQHPILSIPVFTEGECGIQSMALDPNFKGEGFLYVTYNPVEDPGLVRISRFYIRGKTVLYEQPLTEPLHTTAYQHNGGCLRFGADGTLFFSVGDGHHEQNAQDLTKLDGKLCRINSDGTIPGDNPFVGNSSVRPEIYAYGFRNPFRYNVDRSTGQILLNDVGSAYWEEVNDVIPGGNYGWARREGPGGCTGCIDPIISYAHIGDAGACITASAVYQGAQYPEEYLGSYFYSDFVNGWMRRAIVALDGTVVLDEPFADQMTLPLDLVMAPDGYLYYLKYFPGEVYRIDYVGDQNRRPVLLASADPIVGLAPLDVTFDTSKSYDPDGDALTFHYDFQDGSAPLDTTETTVTHRFEARGVYPVTVLVTDGAGGEAQRTISIDADNEAPVPRITWPIDGSLYRAGETIRFSGRASDPEDGTLSPEDLCWTIDFHHNTHFHPFLGPICGIDGGSFEIPTGGESSTDVWYRIHLTATDSKGISVDTYVDVRPRTTTFRVAIDPPGLQVIIDGTPYVAPIEIPSVVGMEWRLVMPSTQVGPDDRTYYFTSWADWSDRRRKVLIPDGGADYAAICRAFELFH